MTDSKPLHQPSARVTEVTDPSLERILGLASASDIITFASGVPDPQLFDVAVLRVTSDRFRV
jgi:hypothetical protein